MSTFFKPRARSFRMNLIIGVLPWGIAVIRDECIDGNHRPTSPSARTSS